MSAALATVPNARPAPAPNGRAPGHRNAATARPLELVVPTVEPMRVGSRCRLDSIASSVARAAYYRELNGAPAVKPCRCIACGCRLLTTLVVCDPCSRNDHRATGGRPWDDAVAVRAAAAFGEWPARLAVCDRCRRPGRHVSLASCVDAAAGDDHATAQVFTRLQVWLSTERRRREVQS